MRRAVVALVAAIAVAAAIVMVGGFLITRTSSSEAERERIRAAGSDRAKLEAELAAIERPFDRLQRSTRLSEYLVLPLAALAGGLVVPGIMKRQAVLVACISALPWAAFAMSSNGFDVRGAILATVYVALAAAGSAVVAAGVPAATGAPRRE